jgi:hypothetical protein
VRMESRLLPIRRRHTLSVSAPLPETRQSTCVFSDRKSWALEFNSLINSNPVKKTNKWLHKNYRSLYPSVIVSRIEQKNVQ